MYSPFPILTVDSGCPITGGRARIAISRQQISTELRVLSTEYRATRGLQTTDNRTTEEEKIIAQRRHEQTETEIETEQEKRKIFYRRLTQTSTQQSAERMAQSEEQRAKGIRQSANSSQLVRMTSKRYLTADLRRLPQIQADYCRSSANHSVKQI